MPVLSVLRVGHDASWRAPVVSIHGDLPYLDRTGLGVPYAPPSGAHRVPISEHTLRNLHGFI